ncbi:MAG: arginine--tRNA ligase [Nanoarchaeota archaeon]|nr:arginine--tRNA ligase [Nanoarchaeota archaeon]
MKKRVVKSLSFLKVDGKELENLIETPKDQSFGDYAFPTFVLAKRLKKNPNEIAKDIAGKIKLDKNFEKVEAVGPYVNFFVNKIKLTSEVINRVSKEGNKYGSGKHGKDKVMIEFSQANTHKAFHVGHIRGTSLGESLSRIFEFCGNKVIRANYQGDTGMHVAKWIWCYNKYHKKEKLRKDEAWIAKIYVEAIKKLIKNSEFQEEVDEINRKLESKKDKSLNYLWKETRKLSLDSLERIYHELNTGFDVHLFESEVEERGKEIMAGLVKKKIAEISDNATIVNLEKYGLGILVFLRKDGTVLYAGKDIALAEKKFNKFKIDKSIYVVGDDQKLYFNQIFKTLELMKFKHSGKNIYVPFNLVRLPTGKMSSRTGENILYSDFKKEVVDYAVKEIEKRYKLESIELYDRSLAIAIASIKYSMLKQDPDKVIIFDKKKALRFEGNTGPYLLYSYARALSILGKASYKKQKKFKIKEVNEYEKRLVSLLAQFPEVVRHSYINLTPSLVANYAYQLAQRFSEFYHNCPVIGSEQEQFRLKLVDSFSQVIKNALWLLGIPVIPEM